MDLKIIHENGTLLVVDKPPGISVFPEGESQKALSDIICEQFPSQTSLGEERRYGIVHRLDKDTSGVLLVAKTPEAFEYLQGQFQSRHVSKTYLCLLWGRLKYDETVVHTLLGRSPGDRRKQRTYSIDDTGIGKREAKSLFRVLQRFLDYTLTEVFPETGRKHQIRAHAAHLGHPIAGDKLYRFKNQQDPEELERQFLHASSLQIQTLEGEKQEFVAKLPEDLETILKNLRPQE